MEGKQSMRVILYTGKGGVGKTSVAAATALRAAEMGHRTIVLSTDPAHSLSDSLDIQLGDEPILIAPNLWGQETELSETLKKHWGTIQRYLVSLLSWQGMDEIAAEELAILPGMEELANLLYIIHYQDEGKFDTVVVDCAPTGETLRLLSFPEILHWWMTRMFPIGKKFMKAVHPIASSIMHIPLPDKDVMNSIEELYQELENIRDLLTDTEHASVRLVVNAEKMVIKEAQRTFTYLNLYGYFTDLIVCNRLIPEGVEGKYFQGWIESQKRYLKIIDESFSPLPIFNVPLMEQEIVGLPMLRHMANALFGDKDPTAVYYHGKVQDISREGGNYVLTLNLPFTSKDKISLIQSQDELTIEVAHFRRNVILPYILAGKKVGEAKMEGQQLKILFEAEEKVPKK